MEHTAIPEPPGFADLSKGEQVLYLRALWDRIAEHPEEIPMPEAHLQLVEERLAAYRAVPSRAVPASEALGRLHERFH